MSYGWLDVFIEYLLLWYWSAVRAGTTLACANHPRLCAHNGVASDLRRWRPWPGDLDLRQQPSDGWTEV